MLIINYYLWGAGLADPEVGCVPLAFVAEPTESLAGRAGVDVITRLVGILVGVPSSA